MTVQPLFQLLSIALDQIDQKRVAEGLAKFIGGFDLGKFILLGALEDLLVIGFLAFDLFGLPILVLGKAFQGQKFLQIIELGAAARQDQRRDREASQAAIFSTEAVVDITWHEWIWLKEN